MKPEEFKALRLKAGYETRGQLAEAKGVTRWGIEHWEYGRRPIPAWGEKQLLKCLMVAKLAEHGTPWELNSKLMGKVYKAGIISYGVMITI